MPSIWVRFDITTSPEYHCQLVLLVKLIAVFIAPSAPIAARPRGFIGSTFCRRRIA